MFVAGAGRRLVDGAGELLGGIGGDVAGVDGVLQLLALLQRRPEPRLALRVAVGRVGLAGEPVGHVASAGSYPGLTLLGRGQQLRLDDSQLFARSMNSEDGCPQATVVGGPGEQVPAGANRCLRSVGEVGDGGGHFLMVSNICSIVNPN